MESTEAKHTSPLEIGGVAPQAAPEANVAGFPIGVVAFAPKGAALKLFSLDGKRMSLPTAITPGSIVAIIPAPVARHMMGQVPPAILAQASFE